MKKYDFLGSVEPLRFQQIANRLVSERTMPVSPKTAPALCGGVCITFLKFSLRRECHSGGTGALRAVAIKSIARNTVRIYQKIKLNRCGFWIGYFS